MRALLKMCAKVALVSCGKQTALTLLVLSVLACVVPLDFVMLYGLTLWMLLSHALVLRAKDKKEGWDHLFLALAGFDWKFPSYLYVFLIVVAILALPAGAGLNWVLQQQSWIQLRPASFMSLASVTAAALFFNQCLLLVSEVIPYENLMAIQKLFFFALIIAGKAVMDWNPAGLAAVLPWILAFMGAFSMGPVCLVATRLFRSRNHI